MSTIRANIPFMRHLTPSLLILAFTGLALIGCGRSFDEQRVDTLKAVQTARYHDALGEVNELYDSYALGEPAEKGGAKKDSASLNEKQLLLWHMERGMISHVAGDWAASDQHLDEAARLVDDRRTKSLTREVGTYVAGDSLREFAGESYEHVQVDYVRALSRLVEAQRDSGTLKLTASCLPAERANQTAPPTPVEVGPAKFSTDDLYNQTMGITRHLAISVLKETADAADGKRFDDDPFARLMAALTTLTIPADLRSDSDLQFADVMVKKSFHAYAVMHQRLAGQKILRYETPARPKLLDTLLIRICRAYDPEGFEQRAKEFGFTENDPRFRSLAPKGSGSVLILNHAGFLTRPEELRINVVAAATLGGPPAPDSTSFHIGAIAAWATGPGSEVALLWPPIPLPPDIVRTILAPGGASYIAFGVPVHAPDRFIPPTAQALLRATGAANGEFPATLEVVSDLDAYARATLKDHQPGVVAKTLIRMMSKQVAAGIISHQVSKKNELLGLAVNLLASATASLTENADLRAWTTLPDHIEAALVDVPPGTYSVTIDPGYGAATVASITVRAGCLAVVPLRTFHPSLCVTPLKP